MSEWTVAVGEFVQSATFPDRVYLVRAIILDEDNEVVVLKNAFGNLVIVPLIDVKPIPPKFEVGKTYKRKNSTLPYEVVAIVDDWAIISWTSGPDFRGATTVRLAAITEYEEVA